MGFEKGHTKIEGSGMKLGQKTKCREIRSLFRNFAIDKFDDFVEEFDKLGGKDKCEMYIKTVKYVLPTISSIKFEDARTANNAVELLRAAAQYKKE